MTKDSSKPLHVFKSSAGSGKTATLAIEYLKLSLGKSDYFRHILALTFTNKAANEMKERILKFLMEIVDYANDTNRNRPFFLNYLLKEMPRYATLNEELALQKMAKDSEQLYKNIIHRYSEYSVSTIDSFTNRIIKAFSHDLGLSSNYLVELKKDILLDLAIEELLSRIDANESIITKVLVEYSHHQINNDKSRKIRYSLNKRAKSLLNDLEETHLEKLRGISLEKLYELNKKIKQSIEKIESKFKENALSFLTICDANLIEPNSFMRSNFYNYFKKIVDGKYDKLIPAQTAIESVEEGKWSAKSVDSAQRELIETHSETFIELFNNIQSKISDYFLLNAMHDQFYPFMALVELEKILNDIKTDQQIVHISDFNKIIAKSIANEPAPYIFERIGSKYKHYLLDEFQDTSVLQWNNLLPLVENGVSEKKISLVVGDSKQAIYRWRGSDVEQFSKFPKPTEGINDPLVLQRLNLLNQSYHQTDLETNYRTGKNIVVFNNRFMEYMTNNDYLPERLKSIYQKSTQLVHKEKETLDSFAQIRALDINQEDEDENGNPTYIQEIYEIVMECKKDGYALKDMAILARKNTILMEIARFFLDKGIPVVSTESLNVDSSPTVKFILSFLKHLLKTEETLYRAEILNFLSATGRLKANIHLHEHENEDFDKFWQKTGFVFELEDVLKMHTYEAIEWTCEIFELDKNDALLHFFIEASYGFMSEKFNNIRHFLEWWNQNSQDYKIDLPEDWDALKLLSFHKAKGLEFPVVINLFFDNHFKNSNRDPKEIWIDPQFPELKPLTAFPFRLSKLENTKFQDIYEKEKDFEILDKINLFYVAMTRPKERLYLLVDKLIEKREKDSEKFTFAKLTHGFLKAEPIPEIKEGIYQFGNRNSVKISHDLKNQIKLSDIQKNDHKSESIGWRNLVALSLEKKDEISLKSDWGIKVHFFFSMLINNEDLESLTTDNPRLKNYSHDELEKLKSMAESVIKHPLLKGLFEKANKVYCEKEFYDENSHIFRPDRVVLNDKNAFVVDYKTGEHNTQNEEQIKYYVKNITRLYKKETIGYLVYPEDEVSVLKQNVEL
jgi:ATP-dependent exoDNAse (exonuclease V) beta subunit